MLAPNSRLMLLDSLRAPTGFTIDAAVGTTYTLSLDALLIPPAAWAVHSIGDRMAGADPILLANSLCRFAERTVVFHHAGAATSFTAGGEELGTFLDEMVFPVRVAKAETFHPKVWVLRFRNSEGDVGLRVLVGSRNLSLDATWDVLVSLDSGPRGPGAGSGGQLAAMLRSLPARTTATLPAARLELVNSLAADLDRSFFVPPDQCESAEVLWWRRGSPPRQLFPKACRSRLIISPFLGADGLARMPKPPAGERSSYLVSRASSLTPQLAGGFDPYTLRTDLAGVEDGAEARIGNELHAKVFAFDHDDGSTVIIGSANATGAAFSANDEVVVRLSGTTDNIGVDALIGVGTGGIGAGEDFELIDVLERWYDSSAPGNEDDDDGRFFEEAIRMVASLRLTGVCQEGSADIWRVTLRLSEPIGDLQGIAVDFRPHNSSTPLPSDFSLGVAADFEAELADISRFVIARFSDPSGIADAVSAVLVADMEVPAGRSRRAMRALLTNREKFARFLRYLLEAGLPLTEAIPAGDAGGSPARRRRSRSPILEDAPILEQLLRLLAARPRDLHQLDAVIKEFDDDDVFPEGFADLWRAIAPLIPNDEDEQ